jgi:SAM-dependent methyltransferase
MFMESSANLEFHRMLVRDELRSRLYQAAIRRAVRPGDVVVDLGAGSGILSLFACQAGAARVYAVEITDVISVAEQLAHDNGFADRIHFIQRDIGSLELPESVDVIVSELISKAVLGQRMEELVGLTRDRFLKEGGRIVPHDVELFLAPLESPALYRELEFPAPEVYGLNFSHARRVAIDQTSSGRFQPNDLLAEAQTAYRIDSYRTTKQQQLDAELDFVATRQALLHGFGGWFLATLADEVLLSTFPPGSPSWDNAFFPVPEPVEISQGMLIGLKLQGSYRDESGPLWRWETTVKDAGVVIARYEQCNAPASARSDKAAAKHAWVFLGV